MNLTNAIVDILVFIYDVLSCPWVFRKAPGNKLLTIAHLNCKIKHLELLKGFLNIV